MSLEDLAHRRDELRDDQVRDRREVKHLRHRLARRGRRLTQVAQRIRHLRRQEVHQSDDGRDFLIREEGVRLDSYNDSAGHCTIGVGHLISLASCGAPRHISMDEAKQLLASDVAPCETAVKEAVHKPLNQPQKDALISLAFNIGTGGLRTSTLVARINAGASNSEIRDAFLMWVIPPELRPRREREADLFINGNY